MITINIPRLKENNLEIDELCMLLYTQVKNRDKSNVFQSLKSKGLAFEEHLNGAVKYKISPKGVELITSLVVYINEKPEINIVNLARHILALFPQGKKEGTKQYWRCSTMEMVNRLKSFFKKYDDYDYDDVIVAATKYVNSFKQTGNYQFMRLAKYFVWKKDLTTGEESSELATYIENLGTLDEEPQSQDWTTTLK